MESEDRAQAALDKLWAEVGQEDWCVELFVEYDGEDKEVIEARVEVRLYNDELPTEVDGVCVMVKPGWYEETLVTPDCCDRVRETRGVFLQLPRSFFFQADYEAKPQWEVPCPQQGSKTGYHLVRAEFCPFCGKSLPEIERNPETPSPIHSPIDDGGYCDSCGERSRWGCVCAPPELRWRVKREEG